MRHTLAEEFHHIYVFNLRGNQRTSGELSRREGGKVFGAGSRNTVTITLLVREQAPLPAAGAQIHYRDIGDYLTAEQKLAITAQETVDSIDWSVVRPNASADWITQRDSRYDTLIPLAGRDGLFVTQSNGLKTNRDPWVYGSASSAVVERVEAMVGYFNAQVDAFSKVARASEGVGRRSAQAASWVERDGTRFSWDQGDYDALARGELYAFDRRSVRTSLYRPFMKQVVVFDPKLNNRTYRLPGLFPRGASNLAIGIVAPGSKSPFGAVATDVVPCLHVINSDGTTYFARWRYEAPDPGSLLSSGDGDYTRLSNLNPAGVRQVRELVGEDLTEDQVFAYVYGVLHSPEFRNTFTVNLKKEAPRVPLAADRATFEAFAAAGQDLLDLHVGYDGVDPYPLVEEWAPGSDPEADPSVLLVGARKMRYPKVADPVTGEKGRDKTRLIYNDHLTLSGIPLEAHDYVLGTRSGVDWIIDRWYVKTDKASGIVNDVNQWGLERGEPRYIIDLIKRVVTVSVRTVEIVNGLPKLTF